MRVIYYKFELPNIVEEIKDYIEESDDTPQQKAEYRRELSSVKMDFNTLIESGVFHDAIGKVTCDFGNCVEVETEY